MNHLIAQAGLKSTLFLIGKLRDTRPRQEEWTEACLRETGQVGQAVAIALLSLSLNRQPLDDEVQNFLREQVDSPTFSARVRRLLQELFNSPSKRRRKRLAAVLLGGPTAVPEADALDRLDLLVSALLDADVDALESVRLALEAAGSNAVPEDRKVIARPDGERAILTLGETMNVWVGTYKGAIKDVAGVSRISLFSLQAAGCMSVGPLASVRGNSEEDGTIRFHALTIEPLGRFLLDALRKEPIRSGIADSLGQQAREQSGPSFSTFP